MGRGREEERKRGRGGQAQRRLHMQIHKQLIKAELGSHSVPGNRQRQLATTTTTTTTLQQQTDRQTVRERNSGADRQKSENHIKMPQSETTSTGQK